LKRTKLDEIPQLWNVVRGDMNLVGRGRSVPSSSRRPCARSRLRARFVVRPGMTGLAQLRGGYFTHPRDKLRYDILYIRNRSMLLDVKLVLGTFVKLLNRWLTLGLLLLSSSCPATFLPALFRGPIQVELGGFNLSPFEVLGLVLVAAALARQIPAHRSTCTGRRRTGRCSRSSSSRSRPRSPPARSSRACATSRTSRARASCSSCSSSPGTWTRRSRGGDARDRARRPSP
jgi:hypothetical protein